jgi:hypothetical protein
VAAKGTGIPNALPAAFDPIERPDEFLVWVENYLLPGPLGGGGHRAHQFTINGLTYPFVRYYNFAAVPDPLDSRRYDMYSGLYLSGLGDLVFFFQADPQAPGLGINSRRGIRGIYRVVGQPYRASRAVRDTISGVGYELLDKCPGCGTFHATFKDSCPVCGTQYPTVPIGGQLWGVRVLSSQLPIEPLVAFEKSVSDERVYADMSDRDLVWIGRHDNAMGAGKGSSIRQLLPEEALRLARLLITEPDQSIGAHPSASIPHGSPLAHATGQPIDMVPIGPSGQVAREDELYYVLVRQLFQPGSNLRKALGAFLPKTTTWDHIEYASSTFPWGYTGGASDFVFFLRGPPGRNLVVIIECKRGVAHDEAVLQAILYIERVLQVVFLSAPATAVPPSSHPVIVLPIVLAFGKKRPHIPNPIVALPKPYSITRTYLSRTTIHAGVTTPLFLSYAALRPVQGASLCSSLGFSFVPLAPSQTGLIDWKPPAGATSTSVEITWILNGSWAAARTRAGI